MGMWIMKIPCFGRRGNLVIKTKETAIWKELKKYGSEGLEEKGSSDSSTAKMMVGLSERLASR